VLLVGPVIDVPDLDKAIDFYSAVLDLRVTVAAGPDGKVVGASSAV
jgi:catechol 2,3-dioxygenase-like lactoylglutathione lyase family enzyme